MSFIFMPRRKGGARTFLIGGLLVAIAEWLSATQGLAQATTYTVTEIPTTDTGQVLSRLNNWGDFAGRAGTSAGQIRATTWSHGSRQERNLGILSGGEYSAAFSINDAGQVVGASNTGTFIVPFLWKPTGGLQRLPLPGGHNCGQAFSINAYGHVVGYSSGSHGTRAFLWIPETGVSILGPLAGGSYSRARAVNDADQTVGTSGSPSGDRAVLWTKGGTVWDLGTLPGDSSSEAMAINNNGDVVGYSKGTGGLRAFLWTESGGMEDLGTLPGAGSSRALDINDSGVVVGAAATSSGQHAFVWTKPTGIIDLNDAVSDAYAVVVIDAHAINGNGQILASGQSVHGMMGSADQPCAPAPPLNLLLTPVTWPLIN